MKNNCKSHTEYGRHKSDSLCPFAENESSKSQHTPTPWNVHKEDDGRVTIYQQNAPYDNVTLSHEPAYGNRPYEGIEADAAFIVRAVNAHEAFEKIREEMKGRLDTGIGCDPCDLERYLKAVAKAEGK